MWKYQNSHCTQQIGGIKRNPMNVLYDECICDMNVRRWPTNGDKSKLLKTDGS